jgi:retron-type reverse transcriptase
LAMSLTTPEKIRTLQRKLYRKAKAEPAFRFYLLYDKIYREDILRHAYELARANAGAAGVDGMTFARIEALGLEAWLAGLRKDLVSKTYRPDPVRRVSIPKADGVGERLLGIPTIRDRVVQTAAKLVLGRSLRRTSRTLPTAIAPHVGQPMRLRRCTGTSAGATPTWLTPICPNTSIQFHTASFSNRWLAGSWTGTCCG